MEDSTENTYMLGRIIASRIFERNVEYEDPIIVKDQTYELDHAVWLKSHLGDDMNIVPSGAVLFSLPHSTLGFLRGIYDVSCRFIQRSPLIQYYPAIPLSKECRIYFNIHCAAVTQIVELIKMHGFVCRLYKSCISFQDTNMVDFMGAMNPSQFAHGFSQDLICQVELDDPLVCVMPTKARPSEVGYDLTIVREAKRISSDVIMYDTGVRVKPELGFYIEVVPRSSLSKSGWMMANSVGVIDNSYRGNLMIALVRAVPNAPEITLPFKGFQMIFRPQVNARLELVDKIGDETARGTGGFGSTNEPAARVVM